jgi:hypothetical protein
MLRQPTWPHTREVLEEQFRGMPEADVCKLTSTNCARLFDLAI